MNLVYSVDAVEDLVRLRKFIEIHNSIAAQQISAELIKGITSLTGHPKIGRPVPKAPDPELIRDLIIGDYIVRYILNENLIGILRIWHQREDREDEF